MRFRRCTQVDDKIALGVQADLVDGGLSSHTRIKQSQRVRILGTSTSGVRVRNPRRRY